jgi:hypothetical protein
MSQSWMGYPDINTQPTAPVFIEQSIIYRLNICKSELIEIINDLSTERIKKDEDKSKDKIKQKYLIFAYKLINAYIKEKDDDIEDLLKLKLHKPKISKKISAKKCILMLIIIILIIETIYSCWVITTTNILVTIAQRFILYIIIIKIIEEIFRVNLDDFPYD